jgi:hypothetical protein
MNTYQRPLRGALLGSALAFVALAPAMGANGSSADLKRERALHGAVLPAAHAVVPAASTGKASGRAGA